MSGQETKCLVIIVSRDKGEQTTELYRPYQLCFTYGVLALGTAGSDLLNCLGIGGTDKELLFCYLPAQLEHKVMHRIAKGTQIRKIGHGIMFTMPLSGISSLLRCRVLYGGIYEEEEMEQKEHKYEPITAVVEHGWRDQAMGAAKETNATGGTALHARSLHEGDAASFLDIRLQGEKDIVVILSVYKDCKQIMHEINMAAGLQTKAKGLIFSMSVDGFIGM